MNTINIDSAIAWQAHFEHFYEANFLQSWQWGEFQQSLGKSVFRLVMIEGKKTLALVQAVKEPARRGTYLAIAGGPLVEWQDQRTVLEIFKQLRALAQQQNCVFIRFRPQVEASFVPELILKQLGVKLAPMHLTADLTIEIDLTKNDEVLLAEMRKQHRQAIKKSLELGISVRQSQNQDDLKQFYREQLAVAKKHGFVPFSENFLTKQFAAFLASDQVTLFHAYYRDRLLASAFVIFNHGEAVYHYGISTPANQEYPGSYACQWAIIQAAKKRGCHKYNLWGVSPKDATQHRFYGVGLFKRGFGGREVAYLPAHDLPLTWQYWLTGTFETIRRKMRKL